MKKSGPSFVCNPPHNVFGTTCKYQRNRDFNPDFRSIFRPCINLTFLLKHFSGGSLRFFCLANQVLIKNTKQPNGIQNFIKAFAYLPNIPNWGSFRFKSNSHFPKRLFY